MRCSSCNEAYDYRGAGADPALCGRCETAREPGTAPPGAPDAFKACPACAEPIRARAKICRFCGHDLLRRTRRSGRSERTLLPKSPGLAACLSFLFSGLGQLYCGFVARGLVIMIGPIVFVFLVLFSIPTVGMLTALYVCFLIFQVWQIFDAYQCAERANRGPARSRHGSRRTYRRRSRRKARHGQVRLRR